MSAIVAPRQETRTVTRVQSVDVVRGIVMVLMAIDHVRVYSGQPAGGPTAGIFFTRWVTHFCAPAFAFYAGTSAFLYGRKIGDPSRLARYLVTRGLLLVLLELTLIRFTWRFTLDASNFLAGVIWMLGWCMVLLAATVRLSPRVHAVVGLAIVGLQQIFYLLPRVLPASLGWVARFLYTAGTLNAGPVAINVLYSIVPWIGVMMLGYAFGSVLLRDPASRNRFCLRVGLSATSLFIGFGVVAYFVLPRDGGFPILFQILNPPKYPASQIFLLMTLGPTIALMPAAERMRGWFAEVMKTFGRVPFFYYLLHIPLIHATSLLVWYLRDGAVNAERFNSAPYVGMPPEQWWPLSLLYAVWLADVAVLYGLCRWYARAKVDRPRAWMRYV
jgi:uncharacterized membrane protein